MTAAVSTLLEIGDLVRTRPGLDAPRHVVAAWYAQKSVVLHHIATETGDPDAALLADALLGGLPGQGKAAAVWTALPGEVA